MSIDPDAPAVPQAPPAEKGLAGALRFLRTPSLGRSVVLLLAGVLALLLLVNVSTFLLIQRTAEINQRIDDSWQVRRLTRTVLLTVQEAETAQRGFLLTGQPGLIATHNDARRRSQQALADLAGIESDSPEAAASVQRLTALSREKFDEMALTFDAVRQGRIGEAVSVVRSGRGQAIMDQIDAEIAKADRRQGLAVAALTASSRSSAAWALGVNAVSGLLILLLALVIALLVRRYLIDVERAREALDRVNAGLEETVRARTAALSRANEEVQRFAYIVSHDLRSPLVNVMGYTSELEQAGKTIDRAIAQAETERPVDPEVVAAVREDMPEAIGFIRASTEKMDRLINAILKLSREGRRNLVSETLDMTAMVSRIADSVRHQVEAADAEVIVEPLPTIDNDRLSIEQIMGNLVDNAVKYLDPARPGRIVVSGRDRPGGWVEYEVADNGRGIAERDRERIFELFRRAGRQDRPGEGLGLAFVRNSVRRLGGSIDVESELGKGSTFRLKFPKRLVQSDVGDDL
ncbi:sensor histidine kinase [Brevundimonas sp.]|uniref:sensor histidine kinase n=1 Tax=Brevundimonas sp. TaxID=1871086 RepID=UPI004034C0E3